MFGGCHAFKRGNGLQMSSAQRADLGLLLCTRDQRPPARVQCGGCQVLDSTWPLCSCLATELAAWMSRGLAELAGMPDAWVCKHLGHAMLAAYVADQHWASSDAGHGSEQHDGSLCPGCLELPSSGPLCATANNTTMSATKYEKPTLLQVRAYMESNSSQTALLIRLA